MSLEYSVSIQGQKGGYLDPYIVIIGGYST